MAKVLPLTIRVLYLTSPHTFGPPATMSDYAHVPGGSLKFKGAGEKYVYRAWSLAIMADPSSERRRRNLIPLPTEPRLIRGYNNPTRRTRARQGRIEKTAERSPSRM
jgi:hypothetical protein